MVKEGLQGITRKILYLHFIKIIGMYNAKRNNVLALLMTLLFTAYYGSMTLFPHVHYIGNTVIRHSHPYTNASHTHNSNTVTLLQELSQIILTIPGAAVLLAAFRNLIIITAEKIEQRYIYKTYSIYLLRGPPASV